MRIALIAPVVVTSPSTGFRTRLLQIQTILARIAPGAVTVWNLSQQRAIALSEPMHEQGSEAQSVDTTSAEGWRRLILNQVALAAYRVPFFSVKTLGSQRALILQWIDDLQPTHIVLIHPYGSELISDLKHRPAKLFVDCQNVESDLALQLVELAASWRERQVARVRRCAIERWERRYFPLADGIWLPSDIDVARQRRVCNERAYVRCVPNALELSRFEISVEQRTHDVVLPGFFGYQPNVIGAQLLSERVWPAVRNAMPSARLVLLGRDPQGMARRLERAPDIIATGEVADTLPYLRKAGVVVAPILQGGGTRYKILEALALGLPVVTTPLGCEGLEVRDGEHLLIRKIEEFAEAIVGLLQAAQQGEAMGNCGRRLIAEKYSWDVVERVIRDSFGITSSTAHS